MQEQQQQLGQWQFAGAALDQNGGLQNVGFQGICRICGVKGHKARDCVAKCPHCGKTGHAARNCFELEVNAHRRPPGWRSQNPRGANGDGTTVRAGNLGGVPQEMVQRACGICQSPAHVDVDCPTAKLKEITDRMNERGASLRVEKG